MKQEETINEIIKLIEKKQKRKDFGEIKIYFKEGKIISVSGNATERIEILKGE